MFSNWETTYDSDNKKAIENKEEFRKGEIKDWFKNKYHDYHRGFYKTEHETNLGVHGDQPLDKFSIKNQVDSKQYSDNYQIGLGTTKTTKFIPGYSGHLPVNNIETKNSSLKDPYFNVSKTNHMLNYKVRIPGHKGYFPLNPSNIKGNTRPYCLSTTGETFS